MKKRELEAEVVRLRAEVTALRAQQAAHVCPSLPKCTCTTGITTTTTTIPCPVHSWPKAGQVWVGDVPLNPPWYFPTNVCAGGAAAGVPQSVIMNTAAAQPMEVMAMVNTTGCAAPPPQIMTFTIPSGP